jgi:hypothetical protein
MEALPGYLFRRDNGAGTRWLQRGAEIRFRPGKRPKSFKSGRFARFSLTLRGWRL